MMEWWNALPGAGRVFALIAIPATIVMILQTILLLIGMGGGGDGDLSADADTDFDGGMGMDTHIDFGAHDFDTHMDAPADSNTDGHSGSAHDGLSLFSIRGIVAFFSIGGWVGLVTVVAQMPLIESVVLSVVAGSAALVGIAWIMKNALRLQDNGNYNLKDAVGKTGTVYLTIPEKDHGKGKISLQTSAAFLELDALNSGSTPIPTGAEVEVCALADDSTVVVRALHIPEENERGRGISKWS